MGVLRTLLRAADRNKEKKLHEQFKGEPVWASMEKVMKTMKQFYQDNQWVFTDKNAMATLESLRVDFEKHEKQLVDMTEKAKVEEHNKLEERMDRMHDKKKLELELKTMKREYDTLKELKTLHDAGITK